MIAYPTKIPPGPTPPLSSYASAGVARWRSAAHRSKRERPPIASRRAVARTACCPPRHPPLPARGTYLRRLRGTTWCHQPFTRRFPGVSRTHLAQIILQRLDDPPGMLALRLRDVSLPLRTPLAHARRPPRIPCSSASANHAAAPPRAPGPTLAASALPTAHAPARPAPRAPGTFAAPFSPPAPPPQRVATPLQPPRPPREALATQEAKLAAVQREKKAQLEALQKLEADLALSRSSGRRRDADLVKTL